VRMRHPAGMSPGIEAKRLLSCPRAEKITTLLVGVNGQTAPLKHTLRENTAKSWWDDPIHLWGARCEKAQHAPYSPLLQKTTSEQLRKCL
jgi:hypothetical protein